MLFQRQQQDPGAFHVFLHEEVRSPELARLPSGASTVLHGGCAGTWYFDWFAKHYPTPVERQIGVDAYAAAPDPLPAGVEWLARSLGDLEPVGDANVDLVYAGQVIEHLWPEEVAGFLCESHRVLRTGGWIALDSPNRRITKLLDWNHPEHTIEFTVDEIVELLELAGFTEARTRGLWLCYERERSRSLPLEYIEDKGQWPASRRIDEAEQLPEDSFIWWVEAAKADREPDRPEIERRLAEIYGAYRGHRLGRLHYEVGRLRTKDGRRLVSARKGRRGHLVYGPYVPMPPGSWQVTFRLTAGPPSRFDRLEPGDEIGEVDVAKAIDITRGLEEEVVAARTLVAGGLRTDGALNQVTLPFDLAETAFGVQFRLRTAGRVRVTALFEVEVEEARVRPSPPEAILTEHLR